MEEERAFKIHWPALFPGIWLEECQPMQLDVTILSEVQSCSYKI